ncbi:MAG: acireductone synthase [Janthinobacterium lividum]
MAVPSVVLIDIEGTTTPIAFVHRVLFPHARMALPALVTGRSEDVQVAQALAEIERLAPGRDTLAQLFAWMDEDAKVTPLKTLQGITWRDGYEAGTLTGELYFDVAPALRRWHEAGLLLAVYSSGSEDAQKLIFGHSQDGDLAGLFSRFFDTRVGTKRDAESYAGIVGQLGVPPGHVLFLSDIVAELDAAASVGLLTCQLVREQDGTEAGTVHPVATDFDVVSLLFGLPLSRQADIRAGSGS